MEQPDLAHTTDSLKVLIQNPQFIWSLDLIKFLRLGGLMSEYCFSPPHQLKWKRLKNALNALSLPWLIVEGGEWVCAKSSRERRKVIKE